jgi:hypothetical protein
MHWFVVGQPVPPEKGQQTQTHLVPVVTTTVASAPLVVVVSCQVPVVNVEDTGADVRSTVPEGTHTVWTEALEEAPPLIVTSHQES